MPFIVEEMCYRSYNNENTIVGYVFLPEGKNYKGIVQIIHGMSEYTARYQNFAKYLCGHGFIVCGHDQAGHGSSVGAGETFGFFGLDRNAPMILTEDARYLQSMMVRRFGKVPYFLFGHSMGSFVARKYAAQYGERLSALILSGTGTGLGILTLLAQSILKGEIKRNGPTDPNPKIATLVSRYCNRKFRKDQNEWAWLSRDPEVWHSFQSDPLCGFPFTGSAYASLLDLMKEVNTPESMQSLPKKLPIFLLSGSMDPIGDYGKGVLALVQKLEENGQTQVECKLYEGGRHEMLNEVNREEVYQDILSFIGHYTKKDPK